MTKPEIKITPVPHMAGMHDLYVNGVHYGSLPLAEAERIADDFYRVVCEQALNELKRRHPLMVISENGEISKVPDLFPADELPIPILAQIRCVEREIGYRQRCYPRWVASGSMGQAQADRELESMRAVLETLQRVANDGSAP